MKALFTVLYFIMNLIKTKAKISKYLIFQQQLSFYSVFFSEVGSNLNPPSFFPSKPPLAIISRTSSSIVSSTPCAVLALVYLNFIWVCSNLRCEKRQIQLLLFRRLRVWALSRAYYPLRSRLSSLYGNFDRFYQASLLLG